MAIGVEAVAGRTIDAVTVAIAIETPAHGHAHAGSPGPALNDAEIHTFHGDGAHSGHDGGMHVGRMRTRRHASPAVLAGPDALRSMNPRGFHGPSVTGPRAGRAPLRHGRIRRDGAADTDELTDGEVRTIDRDAGRLTLRHGPSRNLGMPGTTRGFDVADAAVLDRLRPGERVRFQAEKSDGRFVVVRIEATSSSSSR